MFLQHILRDHFAPQKLRGRKNHTRDLYSSTIGLFAVYLEREPTIEDLTDSTVSAFLSWYAQRETVTSARSVNNRRSVLCAFWSWCARKRFVEQFPDVEKLPEPPIDTRAWTLGEIDSIFRAVQDEPQVGRQPGWLYWSTIHLFWWDTGERTGATLAAKWSDYAPPSIFIAGELRKTGKPATYTLKTPTVDKLELMRLIDPTAEVIFAAPFSLATFYDRYTRILKRAGLPTGRRNKPQKMRRSFASHLEAAGGNATEALQHSSRRVTEASYIDSRVVVKPPANRLLPEVG